MLYFLETPPLFILNTSFIHSLLIECSCTDDREVAWRITRINSSQVFCQCCSFSFRLSVKIIQIRLSLKESVRSFDPLLNDEVRILQSPTAYERIEKHQSTPTKVLFIMLRNQPTPLPDEDQQYSGRNVAIHI